MGGRLTHLFAVASVAAALAGCGTSTPARFYTLDSTATTAGAPVDRATILVGPVSVPAAVDQPEFVVRVAPNRVELDEFNRWAAPLGDGIAQAVAGDLAVLLDTRDVATGAVVNFNPTYRVTIDVQRFESVRGEAALVEALWTVRSTQGGEIRAGRTVAREAVQGDSFDALAAAHSRALAQLSADIAAAIRGEAAQRTAHAARQSPGARRGSANS